MDALDCPDASQLTATRNSSVTVSQALALLNDPMITRYSEHFAARLERDCGNDLEAQIAAAVELTLGRKVQQEELLKFKAFAEKHGAANFCRALFNSNEFMFIN